MRRCLTAVTCAFLVIALVACAEDEGNEPAGVASAPVIEDPGPVHVHGLGVNPADEALFVATHTGLFRVARGEQRAERVAGRYQDTMGFTVTGPDRFLGSGHPDGRDELPPFLGLIRSTDAGRTWKPVSLLGDRDFHVLEASGEWVYGYGSDFESQRAGLLVSEDGGRSWSEHEPPEPLASVAIDPRDPRRAVAAGERGTYSSRDGGAAWRPLSDEGGLLSWPDADALFVVGFDGAVARSRDAGRSWQPVGEIGGPPAAFDNAGSDLYVALHDGTVKRSADGGRTWTLRSRP